MVKIGAMSARSTLHTEAGQARAWTQTFRREIDLTQGCVALLKIQSGFAFKTCESDTSR